MRTTSDTKSDAADAMRLARCALAAWAQHAAMSPTAYSTAVVGPPTGPPSGPATKARVPKRQPAEGRPAEKRPRGIWPWENWPWENWPRPFIMQEIVVAAALVAAVVSGFVWLPRGVYAGLMGIAAVVGIRAVSPSQGTAPAVHALWWLLVVAYVLGSVLAYLGM